jgi:hypothetical protein
VWISRQDWQNFRRRTWLGACKPTFDELMLAFDGILAAVEHGDPVTFIAGASDCGVLERAAAAAGHAAERAESGAEVLRLAGTQRWSASEHAISASDAAIAAVSRYAAASTAVGNHVVRELALAADAVRADSREIAARKGHLITLLVDARRKVRDAFDGADEKVAEMAEIDRIDSEPERTAT